MVLLMMSMVLMMMKKMLMMAVNVLTLRMLLWVLIRK
jgi:hypothetical protein